MWICPKGLLLLGVQGGRKSLSAKTVAGLWSIPLLMLDMGALRTVNIDEIHQTRPISVTRSEDILALRTWAKKRTVNAH